MKTYRNQDDLFKAFAEIGNTNNDSYYPQGRCGNVFFENATLYSYGYHYAIAKFITPDTVLFNDYRYSNSTAKQLNKAQAYLGRRNTLLKVYYPQHRPIEILEHELSRLQGEFNTYSVLKRKNTKKASKIALNIFKHHKAIQELGNINIKRLKDFVDNNELSAYRLNEVNEEIAKAKETMFLAEEIMNNYLNLKQQQRRTKQC